MTEKQKLQWRRGANSLLSQLRFENGWRLQALLETDFALTDAQLARFGLGASHLPSVALTVQPMTSGDRHVDVVIRTFNQIDLEVNDIGMLRHTVGVAQIRHELAIPASNWRLDRSGNRMRPDATADIDGFHFAVEFDAGYSAKVVSRKMEAFRESHSGIIWGTSSELRCERLSRYYPYAFVLFIDYWSWPPKSATAR